MTARTAYLITAILGVLFSILGIFTSLQDFGIGLAVACAGVIGWEFETTWRDR